MKLKFVIQILFLLFTFVLTPIGIAEVKASSFSGLYTATEMLAEQGIQKELALAAQKAERAENLRKEAEASEKKAQQILEEPGSEKSKEKREEFARLRKEVIDKKRDAEKLQKEAEKHSHQAMLDRKTRDQARTSQEKLTRETGPAGQPLERPEVPRDKLPVSEMEEPLLPTTGDGNTPTVGNQNIPTEAAEVPFDKLPISEMEEPLVGNRGATETPPTTQQPPPSGFDAMDAARAPQDPVAPQRPESPSIGSGETTKPSSTWANNKFQDPGTILGDRKVDFSRVGGRPDEVGIMQDTNGNLWAIQGKDNFQKYLDGDAIARQDLFKSGVVKPIVEGSNGNLSVLPISEIGTNGNSTAYTLGGGYTWNSGDGLRYRAPSSLVSGSSESHARARNIARGIARSDRSREINRGFYIPQKARRFLPKLAGP